MAVNQTNPDKDFDWSLPTEGEVKYINGVLHQFQRSQSDGVSDWYMVPQDGKPNA